MSASSFHRLARVTTSSDTSEDSGWAGSRCRYTAPPRQECWLPAVTIPSHDCRVSDPSCYNVLATSSATSWLYTVTLEICIGCLPIQCPTLRALYRLAANMIPIYIGTWQYIAPAHPILCSASVHLPWPVTYEFLMNQFEHDYNLSICIYSAPNSHATYFALEIPCITNATISNYLLISNTVPTQCHGFCCKPKR